MLGKTEDEYVDFSLSGLHGRLLKNPRLYRSYGPYWPEIKKLLLERGYGQIYSAWHLLPVPEEVDDQDYEFESYDLEVEALAQAGEKT
ncbi:TPA: peptide-binding protein [Escherichia coli]